MTPAKGAEPGWTRGEWTVKHFNADDLQAPVRFDGPAVVYADDDCDIHPIADCSCNHTCRNDEVTLANANLIAAAPDLYEALELTLVALQYALKGAALDAAQVFSFAESSLSKARGEAT